MKICIKIIAFCIIFALIGAYSPLLVSAKEIRIGNISAQSAILIEAESGKALYEKNANKKMPMASTTKIMTAIVAIESGIALDKIVKIPAGAVGVEGSSAYLAEGELVTFEALLYALLLSSANDSAVAIAYEICSSLEGFVQKMNEKASDIGLADTHFTNPHGLDNTDHYTSARDMAILMSYCVKNKLFLTISGCKKKVFPRDDGGVRVMINHNRLLKMNDYVIAGKTGFTKKSGRCLVSCAERDGTRLICVTFNAPNDWNDHENLYEFGFESYETVFFDPLEFTIPIVSGQKNDLKVESNGFSLFLPRNRDNIQIIVEAPRFLYARVNTGEQVGQIRYVCDGRTVGISPLYATETVEKATYKFNLFEWLIDLFKGIFN